MGAQERRSFHLPESRVHYRRGSDIRVEHMTIDVSLDFDKKRITGTVGLRFSPVVSGLRKIRLDASSMSIGKVSVDGKETQWEYDGDRLEVFSASGLQGTHTLEVTYSTTPKGAVYFIEPDKEHPEKPVQAWTQNESDYARHWIPCVDSPDVKCPGEITVKVPKGFTVISNGTLVSARDEGDLSVFHWKEDLPHPPYLRSFVAGKFSEMKQQTRGIELTYYFPEHKRADVLRYFGETPRMIEVFEDVTGVKYPYRKYAQTTVEDFIFGGMENFNATTLAMGYYPDAGSEEDFQTSYASPFVNAVNLVAHELAHQWFGDLVTCRDWSHAWLNEGFATYMQHVYLEKTLGWDQAACDLDARAEEYFSEDTESYRRPIVERDYVYPDDLFDRATYEKGAWMIHELRYLVGDPAFFSGVNLYLKRYSFGNADTHDFRKCMEEASGKSLEAFFEQAFYKSGFPEFGVEYAWDESSGMATVRVRQEQKAEGGTPVFTIPCDLVFYVDGSRLSKTVRIESQDQAFSFSFDSRPDIVEFDPQHRLLKKVRFPKTLDMLADQLDRSEDASSRAEAARGLGELKSDMAVEYLTKAASREQFWNVRAAAVRALGEVGTPDALRGLARVGSPKDRRVRRAVAEALGRFVGQVPAEALKTLLKDESPYVRCEAALSISKSSPEEAFQLLTETMKEHSPNETLAEACLESMGSLKQKEVDAVIIDSLRYGKPTRVRIGALKAIKARGRATDAEADAVKMILLSDKEFRVRQYIASQLIPSLKDPQFLDAVKESSKTDKDARVRRKALEVAYRLGPRP